MSNFADFNEFLRMDPDERDERITDMLASVAEPWLDDPAQGLVVGLIGQTRTLLDAASAYARDRQEGKPEANKYIMGLFAHAYSQAMKNFLTLTGLSDMKRSMKGG